MLGQIHTYNSVKDQNLALNQENSRLRTELQRLKKYVPIKYRSSISKELDTSIWVSTAGEIVRTSTHTFNNLLVANKGLLDGVVRGSGMLDKGYLAGKVIEVTDHEALVFPVTHKNIETCPKIFIQ